jgi:hypothetical protein
MATAAEVLPPETAVAGNDIVVAVTQNPGLVLLDTEKFDAFYTRMKAETDKLVPDTSTAKGRDEIRSMAAKVARSKAAIDKARLGLTAEWRENVKKANAAGSVIEERLAALAAEVRQPLTEWEAAEKARIDDCRSIIDALKASGVITLDDTAATVRQRGMDAWNTAIDPERFGDLASEAEATKASTVETLKAALVRLTREEAERAELEQLRAEAAARAEADRIAAEQAEAQRQEAARVEAERVAAERAAQEAAERAKAEEDRRVAAEKAEAERIERAKVEAEERARRAAEEAAAAERARIEQAHAEQLAAERHRAEEAERAAQVERDRIAREEAARVAEAKRIADEQAKREADQAHRTAVKSRAKAAIMSCGADEETAKKIVLAIQAGEVPHIRLEF